MRKLLPLFALVLFGNQAFSQQSNYQSKVFINGKPATGQHIIHFSIPPLNWASLSKTVNITNGLFSIVIDFPQNLFDDNHTSREMIVFLDNNIIDTVTIYAPIERDPTVRSYIKDSISWVNVHNKPPLDTVPQQLSVKGDSLSISNGNTIKLPDIGGGGALTVNGEFKVIDTALHQSISFLSSSYKSCTGNTDESYWQSFLATENGKLRQISIPVAASCNNFVTVFIYERLGNSTQYIGFKNCPVTNILFLQTLDLSSGVNSAPNGYIVLEKGKIYTFQITPPVGCTVSVGCNDNNPYIDGISNISTNTDIPFAINMDRSAPASIFVSKNGFVGIGVEPATSQLEVNGRIKDQTGYLMPVGSVVSYAGNVPPMGWLLCDGRALKRANYPDLFKAIGTAWGMNDSSDFMLPDTRGMFLRGVDDSPTEGSSGNDPDRSSRQATGNGGNTGNTVGTLQLDAFKSHSHKEHPGTGNKEFIDKTGSGNWPLGTTGNTIGTNTANTGGSETRPINVSFYYIIKY